VGFLIALAVLAVAAIICATVIFIWNVSPRRWARVAAVAGISSLAAGIVLYAVVAWIALNYYDEQSYTPSWLTALAILAVALAGGGLLAIVSATFGLWRRTPREG
jgi:Na+/pantothenate symporter